MKDYFYAALSSDLSSVLPHDYLIVLGDFNAGVADSPGLYDAAVGPVTIEALNDNGFRATSEQTEKKIGHLEFEAALKNVKG
ncbi:hypothetical protein QYM36_004052 [Artemia franciscana]|uniref:Endonuclease/exonuclease/phosphatase domain-containing protein n=1 Tax=Artemia franciscana TaxID=6661 RepID=A0AA88L7P3_ARTSF|nr:hypothetical protein QYM36_004052 [Artemia franciscana]